LRTVELVERAVVTPVTVAGRIGTELRVAQALTLLIDWLALSTSTVTTSSSLLSAMRAAVEWSHVKGNAKAVGQKQRKRAQAKRL
jgi:hypothetical protein